MYVSSLCGDLIAAVILNSSPLSPSEKYTDHMSKLAYSLYDAALEKNPSYHCDQK